AGLDRALDDLREVDLTLVEQQLSARDAAHIEQLAHDALEVAALAVDCLTHRLEHRVTEPLLLHQHHGVADRSERIAQLVREHRDELVHPRRGVLERFRVALLCQVLRDVREARELALPVDDGTQDDLRPVGRTVLADSPSLELHLARAAGSRELVPRSVRDDVLGSIEIGEVAAEDLLRAVAGDALGPCIPGAHEPARIEHEERVIVHALDEEPEALLALAQFLLASAALGKVARDLGEALELAALVAQGRDDDVGPEPSAVLTQPPVLVLETS